MTGKTVTRTVSRKFAAKNFWKFSLIFPKISGNLLIIYVSQLFSSPTLQSAAVK